MFPKNYKPIDEESLFHPTPLLRDGSESSPLGNCFEPFLWRKLFLWTCILGFVLCFWTIGLRRSPENVFVKLKPDKIYRETTAEFLSLALDSSLIRERWSHLNISSVKFLQMAKHLAPGYLRIGGTAADRLVFKADAPNDQTSNAHLMTGQTESSKLADDFMDGGAASYEGGSCSRKDIGNFTMTGNDLLMIYNFSKNAGFKLLFDLNVLLRDGENWDSANAIELINFANSHNLDINWQLGNEPNSFPHVFNVNITGEQLGRDFEDLRNILNQFPRYVNSLLVGPDTTRPKFFKDPANKYLSAFLNNANNAMSAITWHQYYLDGHTATTRDFLNPATLNLLYQQTYAVKMAVSNAVNATSNTPLWLGETGSAYGGGAPGLSNRFIAGFLWLDKLGVAARMGIDVVIRQSLYHGYYSLLEEKTLDPLPDWWLTVVYKAFVGPRVIKSKTLLGPVRLYCHCSANTTSIPAGTVTLYGINVLSYSVVITLKGLPEPHTGSLVHSYILMGEDGLSSKNVMMNGDRLVLNNDLTLPKFKPRLVDVNSIIMPPYSIGFFVLHGTTVKACQE